MQVQGTTVAAADVEGGVGLSFTTKTGDVAELRRRVARMAEMHNQHGGQMMMGGHGAPPAGTGEEHQHGAGPGNGPQPGDGPQGHAGGGMMMGGGTMGGGGMMMPPANASVEDIDGGARLVLRPKDAAQLGAPQRSAPGRLLASWRSRGATRRLGRASRKLRRASPSFVAPAGSFPGDDEGFPDLREASRSEAGSFARVGNCCVLRTRGFVRPPEGLRGGLLEVEIAGVFASRRSGKLRGGPGSFDARPRSVASARDRLAGERTSHPRRRASLPAGGNAPENLRRAATV